MWILHDGCERPPQLHWETPHGLLRGNPHQVPDVTDLSSLADLSALSSVISDNRFIAAVAIALFSGVVRGFSGFGSALIYIPLMAAVYDPRVAAITFVMIDCITGFSFVLGVWRKVVWREVFTLAVPAILSVQLGAMILEYADPISLRWAICTLVALVLVILMSGWRYHGVPHLWVTIGVGLLAGILGGAVQISGPPIIVYWFGSMLDVNIVRANLIAYFGVFSTASVITYAIHGLITLQMVLLTAMLGPLHVAGMWAGGKMFNLASEKTYRYTAYVIVGLSAIIGMPLLDRFLR